MQILVRKIVLIHEYYQIPGGEDKVFELESKNLSDSCFQIDKLAFHNDLINRKNVGLVGLNTIWNHGMYKLFKKKGKIYEILHFHNTFPLLSPSVFHAAHSSKTATILTLHNFRLLCLNAFFLRNDQPCEQCKNKFFAYPGVIYKCYRNSLGASLATAIMLCVHRLLGTWKKKVDRFIALTEFSRQKFIEGGLPAGKIVVKPNFLYQDPGPKDGPGKYALFIGRLSREKGVLTLIESWSHLNSIPLRVAGIGPLDIKVAQAATGSSHIEYLGALSSDQVINEMKGASFLIIPSTWYENFPLTIVEAFACGLPVIASHLGSMAELVKENCTGIFFESGNAKDLADKVNWAWNHPQEMIIMGRNARLEYESKYTAEINSNQLLGIYTHALKNRTGYEVD